MKFGLSKISLPSESVEAIFRAQNDGNITEHSVNANVTKEIYVSDLYVGNPPQKVRAQFDTGSANTWVMSEKSIHADSERSSEVDNSAQQKVFIVRHGVSLCNIVKDNQKLDKAKNTALWGVDAKLTDDGTEQCLNEH